MALNPYRRWIESGTLYLCRKDQLCAMQDAMVFLIHALGWGLEVLLSPAALEKAIVDMPFFGSFRSKELRLPPP